MKPARLLLALGALALLGSCGAAERTSEAVGPSAPDAATEDDAVRGPSLADLLIAPEARAASAAALPEPGEPPAGPAPHVYLALQPAGSGQPVSAVFAIDSARDGTPSDDPAIRLTPEGGNCNPQEMRRYAFPAEAAPVVSEAERDRGLTARELPRFLAAEVTGRMIEAGLAAEPEDTRPLNVCTRKLWERLVLAGNRDRLAAGQ